MPDGMMYKPAGMIPLDLEEFSDWSDVISEMLGESGSIFNESLHRPDIGNAVSEVGQNVRGAQKRAWIPDPDFAVNPELDIAFDDAANDPEHELIEGEVTVHETLDAS